MVSSHTKASLPSTVPQTHSVGYGEIRGPQKLCHSFTFLSSELKKNKNKKKISTPALPTFKNAATQQLEYGQGKRKSRKNDFITRNRGI